MWTFLLILISIAIILLSSMFWVRLVNSFFSTTFRQPEFEKYYSKKKSGSSDIQPSKQNQIEVSMVSHQPIIGCSVLCDGVYKKENLPKRNQDSWVYFQEYLKEDGAWVEANEPVCKLRIGEYKESYEAVTVKSSKSGFLEQTKRGAMLFDHNIIFKIIEKGNIIDSSLINNERYEHNFNTTIWRFEEWLVDDGSFVKADTAVYKCLEISSNETRLMKVHKAEIDGFIDIHETPRILADKGTILLYVIQKDDSKRVSRKFKNKHKITVDEFQGSKIIQWESVSTGDEWSWYGKRYHEGIGSKSDDQKVGLLFGFNYLKGRDQIVFHFNPKEINIQVNDVIEFLFENDRRIGFEISSKPISTKNKTEERISEYYTVITQDELELFANVNLKKWKITFENGMKEVLGGDIGGIENYSTKDNLQIAIKKFAQDYMAVVKNEIENYTPVAVREEKPTELSTPTEACYVYLMHDITNGFYKIGISNNPEYRERTLQSEKPTIEMIISKKFPVRKIAEVFEKSLHAAYAEKRIRGEWFSLDPTEVKHLKIALG